MNPIQRFIALIVWVIPLLAPGQPVDGSPAAYNNYIVSQHNALVNLQLAYATLAIQKADEETLMAKSADLVENIDTVLVAMKALDAYKGNIVLKQAGIATFSVYKEVFSQDILRLIEKRTTRFESVKNLEAYFRIEEETEAKLTLATMGFEEAQRQFAGAFQLMLSIQAQTKEVAAIQRLNAYKAYARSVFLEYFTVAHLNAELWAYYDRQEHLQADRVRQDILLKAKRVANRIRKMDAFEGERGYQDAVVDVLTKYRLLAEKEYKQLIAIQEALEQPGRVTTPESVERYNKMVDRHNQIIRTYNQEVPPLLNKMEEEQRKLIAKIIEEPEPIEQSDIPVEGREARGNQG